MKSFIKEWRVAKEQGYLRPWYKILWSLVWFIPVQLSRILCAVLIGIANLDPRDTERFWEMTS